MYSSTCVFICTYVPCIRIILCTQVCICTLYTNLLKAWRYSTHMYHWYTLTKNQTAACAKTVLGSLAWGSLHPINWKLIVMIIFLVTPKVRSSKATDICFFLVETHQCDTLLLFSLLLAVVDWNNNYTQQLHEFINNTGSRERNGCCGSSLLAAWVRCPGFNLTSITFLLSPQRSTHSIIDYNLNEFYISVPTVVYLWDTGYLLYI